MSYILTCLGCGCLFNDSEPSDKSIDYSDLNPLFQDLPDLNEEIIAKNRLIYVCPVCSTDEYLKPNIESL